MTQWPINEYLQTLQSTPYPIWSQRRQDIWIYLIIIRFWISYSCQLMRLDSSSVQVSIDRYNLWINPCYLYSSTSQIRMLLRVCLSLILLRLLTFASPPPPPQNISTNSNESRRQERKVGGWYQCTNVTHQHQKLAIPDLLQNNGLSEDMETAESAQRGAFLEHPVFSSSPLLTPNSHRVQRGDSAHFFVFVCGYQFQPYSCSVYGLPWQDLLITR